MAKKKSLVPEEEYQIEVEEDSVVATDTPETPLPHDPKWTEYVLSHLEDDEKNPEGNPTTDGLRRLVEKFVGDIVESQAEAVRVEPGWSTIRHTVSILTPDGVRKFTEIADVHGDNTEPRFLIYASATASTRAEGRALKKALKLKRVLAAEEVLRGEAAGVSVSVAVPSDPTKMNAVQANMLNAMFSRSNINGWKYVQTILSYVAPNDKYDRLNDIPVEYVAVITEHVQKYQQIDPNTGKTHEVPKDLVGYSSDFLSKWQGTL